jgi:hypothetical protein
MGRPQALDPAAFLVDQHRRIGAADRSAKLGDQRTQLIRRIHIAGKQDEAERVEAGKEPALLGRKARACTTQDDGACHQA